MYTVVLKPKARKELRSLPMTDQQKVVSILETLAENPLIGKQLQGKYSGLRSVRAWPYRIIYAVNHKIITVTVVKIGHRKEVYR